MSTLRDQAIDVRSELQEATVQPFHWVLVGLVALATIFDGYDTFTPVYVIHFVAKPWGLAPGQAGFLMSSGLIGFAVGSLAHGIVADRIGRRPTLIAGLLIAGVFSLLTGFFGHSFGSFIALRLLTGLGLGVLMPLGTAYINEYLPGSARNRLAVLGGAGFSVGAVVASIVGIFFTRQLGWEVLYWVGACAAAAGIAYIFVFPESLEYLVAHGRQQEAARLIVRVRPERRDVYAERTLAVAEPPEGTRRDWRVLLSPGYRTRSIALWVSSFMLLFDIYGLSSWTPNLMIARGSGFATGFAFGAILQGLGIVGGLACGHLADRVLGQRISLMIWCGLGAVAAVLMGELTSVGANIGAVAAAGFFIIGGQFVLNNLCAMTYPVHARGTGEGFMLGAGRIGGILGPYIGGVLLGAFGTSVPFFAVAAAAALAVISSAFVVGTGKPRYVSPLAQVNSTLRGDG